eukprot:TRINITY_DN6697_c0_g1_i1.p1 TRINITY_DN6697_c0_g1~~TRINITY_DN6697_c0_g1_i1.p1  ORF type:complete len:857 (+),score=148.09 TRINITY_DN6697_c0_g1_i1:32-2572(+)
MASVSTAASRYWILVYAIFATNCVPKSHALLSSDAANSKVYAVLLKQLPPAASYEGGHANFLRTSPLAGARLDSGLPHVQEYTNHLLSTHVNVLTSLNLDTARKLYSYTHTLNGFAIALTPEELAAVEAHDEVGMVVESRRCYRHTTHTPDFLSIPGSLWQRAGGVTNAGENIIIGVIDTGINPDHPSFSDKVGEPYVDIHLLKPWRGSCELGDPKFKCNKKLIGAKFFVAALLAGGDTVDTKLDAYSPRDVNGHGSHTASTAGGNYGIRVEGIEAGVEYGSITGMAPRARIAAYKGLWYSSDYPGSDYGMAVDLLAALDAAVSDGVDVINYSIGPSDDFFDLWALGVLHAAKAGVFVSASAGNEGPGPSTLSHVAPWYLSVAASTHDREYQRSVTLGNGKTFFGQGISSPPVESLSILQLAGSRTKGTATGLESPYDEATIIWGGAAVVEGMSSAYGNLCIAGALDPAKVKGKVVLCQRGGNGRAAKGEVVYDAGGVGMVLWNDNEKEGLITDIHFVPALHVIYADGLQIFNYVQEAGENATVQLSSQLTSFGNEAPAIIDFSSRGPVSSYGSSYPKANDVLKPDIAAPGVSIWAAYAPAGDPRHFIFNTVSGTSMASPHVAGIGALIKQAHPEWDPFMIKSAIQTTALINNNKGRIIAGSPPTISGTPFDFGSGQINPTNVTDPGLIYPSAFEDYVEFLFFASYSKALSLSGQLPPRSVRQPRDLNTPNIAISQLVEPVSVTKTVLSVATSGPPLFTVIIEAPKGVKVDVVPMAISISPGETATFTVAFSVLEPSPAFQFGSLTWTNGHYSVKTSLAVQPTGASMAADQHLQEQQEKKWRDMSL